MTGALTSEPRSVVGNAAARHVLGRAAAIGLSMRHSVTLLVAVVALLADGRDMRALGVAALLAAASWSAWRIWTRDPRSQLVVADVAVAVAVCLTIPAIVDDARFHETNSAPQAIAGTTVISVAVALAPRFSLAATMVIAASYGAGAAALIGWAHIGSIMAVYYFAVQWTAAALIRLLLLRVAAAVDRARDEREVAAADTEVAHAVEDFDREQSALLHDTVASTLLLVGQGVAVPAHRLAAQARRDLDVLMSGPWRPADAPADLVAEMRKLLAPFATRVQLRAPCSMTVRGRTAQAVIGATREAINNVERHASASHVDVELGHGFVVITDDGVGFDPLTKSGHGRSNSMDARMRRIGGRVTTASKPSAGTRVEIHWPSHPSTRATRPDVIDVDRLIPRLRVTYALALSAYAVANVAATVPYALIHHGTVVQSGSAVLAVACACVACLTARLPAWLLWSILALLLLIDVVQPLTLSAAAIGTQADWVQSGIGWFVLPLVLNLPLRRAAAILVGFWLTAAVLEVALRGDADAWVNIGYGTGSILGVQLFALTFDGLVRGAASHVHAEVETRKNLIVERQVAARVADDYHARYAATIDAVIPLLAELAADGTVTPARQRRAATESRSIRALLNRTSSAANAMLTERLRAAAGERDTADVAVTVEVSGDIPQPDPDRVDDVVALVRRVLQCSMNSARVVVSADDRAVTVSIVCQGVADPGAVCSRVSSADTTTIISTTGVVWLLVELISARESRHR